MGANQVRTVTVAADEAGLRLDRWFRRRFPEVVHTRLQKWLRTGQVRVDGGRVKAGARLEAGQRVRIPPMAAAAPPMAKARVTAVTPDVTVLHRDDHVLVIDKPAGLAVQGGTGTRRHLDAMLDGLRFGADDRPRLVHRLDKDTSGVLVLARSAAAAARLAAAFRSKEARKLYWALVAGLPRPADGRIDLPLAKVPGRHGERMAGTDAGRRAVTDYLTVDSAGRRAAWLALEPLTGRTHQLRAHCAAAGFPIVGDGKYGGRQAFIDGVTARRLHLHARAIRIPHPAGGVLEVSAPLPEHMRATWRFLGFDADAPACFLGEEGTCA